VRKKESGATIAKIETPVRGPSGSPSRQPGRCSRTTAEIKPQINGRMERVLVQEGQNVRTGQIMGWMSSTERAALIDAARSQGAGSVKYWEA